jgi:hypothetical protein
MGGPFGVLLFHLPPTPSVSSVVLYKALMTPAPAAPTQCCNSSIPHPAGAIVMPPGVAGLEPESHPPSQDPPHPQPQPSGALVSGNFGTQADPDRPSPSMPMSYMRRCIIEVSSHCVHNRQLSSYRCIHQKIVNAADTNNTKPPLATAAWTWTGGPRWPGTQKV